MNRPRLLAHRGACRAAPENTIEAFARARTLGADGVELDVHRTSDGDLVVHHDAEAPGLGVLARLPQGEIRAARPEIPTLGEALDECRGMLVNVEVKNSPGDADFDPDEAAAIALVQLLAKRGGSDDVLVSSFSLRSIGRVRALDPSIPTALLTRRGFDPIEATVLVSKLGHRAINPDVRALGGPVARAVVTQAHELGLEVNVWTVDDVSDITRLARAGVDALITDVPDVARRVLGDDHR